jgi:exopolyphosphatase/guanosine-5'-triphosphate,3'-diphosphate pyrophosphatase
VREAFRLPESARELLVAAALLHDIGFLVNHAKHHKHAYHLIMHSDLAGYSAHDVEVIANVARYHRRAFPKKSHANFRRLDKADRRLVRRLAGILRVAVALDRTHTQIVSGVRCMVKKRRVRLTLLTTSDPSVELWDARRKAALFEKAFGVELKFIRRVAGGRPAIHVVRGAARRAAGS